MAGKNSTVYGATGVVAVTPSDSTVLAPGVRALWVGGTGTVIATMVDGTSATFSAVPAGYLLPIQCTKVGASSTATLILALY